MSQKIFVKVKAERQVRKLENPAEFVNPDGDLVDNSSYYRRRIKDKDLILIKETIN